MSESEQRQFEALEAETRKLAASVSKLEAHETQRAWWMEHDFLPWKRNTDVRLGKSEVHTGRLLLFMSGAVCIASIVAGLLAKAFAGGSTG